MTRPTEHSFRSKAEREREEDLKAQYRDLGNPELVAATRQLKTSKPKAPQMQAHQKAERELD